MLDPFQSSGYFGPVILTGWRNDMHQVQATEAKARFAELLRIVERGETVAITRHGKVVARVSPAQTGDRESRKEAVRRFRARRAQWQRVRMSTEEILTARHDGHRS